MYFKIVPSLTLSINCCDYNYAHPHTYRVECGTLWVRVPIGQFKDHTIDMC